MRIKGFIYTLSSAVLFGGGAVMLTAALTRGMNVASISILRGLGASAALLLIVKMKGGALKLEKKHFRQLIPILGGSVMTSVVLNMAYNYIPTGAATSIHFIYPVMVAAAETLFFRNRISKTATLFLAAATVGVFLQMDGQSGLNSSGVLITLLSSALWSYYIVSFSHSDLIAVDPFILNFYQGIMTMLVGVGYLLASGSSFVVSDFRCVLLALGEGALAGGLGQVFLQTGVTILGGALASVMSVMEPVSSICMSALFLKQRMTTRQLLSCGVIILSSLGLMMTEYINSRKSLEPFGENRPD